MHFKPDAQPHETRSTTAACKGIARISSLRRASQMMVTADPKAVTCERCLAKTLGLSVKQVGTPPAQGQRGTGPGRAESASAASTVTTEAPKSNAPDLALLARIGGEPHYFANSLALDGLAAAGLVEMTQPEPRAPGTGYWRRTAIGDALMKANPPAESAPLSWHGRVLAQHAYESAAVRSLLAAAERHFGRRIVVRAEVECRGCTAMVEEGVTYCRACRDEIYGDDGLEVES